jgi:hypothetical protein
LGWPILLQFFAGPLSAALQLRPFLRIRSFYVKLNVCFCEENAMRNLASTFFCFLLFVFLIFFLDSNPAPVSAQDVSPTPEVATPAGTLTMIPEIPTPSPMNVSYPIHGLKLTGIVKITGSIAFEGWTSYELAFSYADKENPIWFPFATGTNPIVDNALGTWDTTKLSDGDYNLRLRVFSPGAAQDGFIYGLRVRNYTIDTPIPTLTFTPTLSPTAPAATAMATFTSTLTSTVYPTPTELPTNPATLSADKIVLNLGLGALSTMVVFVVFGLLLSLRRR